MAGGVARGARSAADRVTPAGTQQTLRGGGGGVAQGARAGCSP